jgi:NAD(P)H-nitrite reductase large subunit
MAGMRTLEELLKAAPDLYDITVFGDEPHPNYNRIMLSPVLAGEQTVEQIVLNSRDWYAEHGITLHTGKRVVKIDRKKRFVEADDGTRENTTACCWRPARNPSSCRFPAPICPAWSASATSPMSMR